MDYLTRQIRYPLPEVPTEITSVETRDYLAKLRSSVEANLNALFSTEALSGQRIAKDSIPEDRLDFVINTALDFDVPLMSSFVWSAPGGVPTWGEGTINFQGTTYTVVAGAAANNTHIAVYWPGADNTHFGTTTSPTNVANRWYMAFKESGAGTTIYPAFQSTIVHGGLIQADSITATQIAAGTITATEVVASTFIAVGGGAADVNAGETTISGGKITTNSITINQIGPNAVSDNELNSSKLNGVEANATADQTSAQIIDATGWEYTTTTKIDGGEIYTGTVVAGAIVTGTLTATQMAGNTITLAKIASEVTNRMFSSDSLPAIVEGWKYAGQTTIDGGDIQADSILAGSISTYNLTAANATFENLVVKTAAIDNLSIGTGKIINLNVTTGKVADNAITSKATSTASGATNLTISAQTIATISLTCVGGENVLLEVALSLTSLRGSGAWSYARFQLEDESSNNIGLPILQSVRGGSESSSAGVSLVGVDSSVVAGSRTWNVRAWGLTGSGYEQVFNKTMVATEFLK